MALEIKIKKEFETEVVGFNGSGLPLGKRNDLDKLALLALTANKSLLRFFEKIPTLQELKKAQSEQFLEKKY